MSELARQRENISAVKQRLGLRSAVVNYGLLAKREQDREHDRAAQEAAARREMIEEARRRQQEAIDTMPAYALSETLPLSNFSTELTVEVTEVGYGKPELKKTALQIIIEVLEDFPGVSVEDIKGIRRSKHIIRPRQLAIYEVFRQRPDMSSPVIGRIFNRDHTTILHAVKKIEKEMA